MEATEKIVYQNKDIASKTLAEYFKGKTFRVYGLNLPEVTQVLPTNLPTIKANELRLDNLFQLADGTVAIIDYESAYKEENKVKYLNYITGIANRYLKEDVDCPKLRMIVIYTGDIKRTSVSDSYDIGALKIKIESAFLSELNGEDIERRLKEKIEQNIRLSDDEIMEFIIYPLSYQNRKEKVKKIQEAVNLAVQISDQEQQIFVLSGLLVFADKIIDLETANKIRRVIEMTKIAQIFEEEKIAYGKEMATNARKETTRNIVENLLKDGMSPKKIVQIVSNITLEEVKALEKDLFQTV